MSLPTGQPSEHTGVTLINWRAHPWQMWALAAITVWAIAILSDSSAYIHTIPLSDINNPAMLNLVAGGMLVGAVISLLGLQMNDRDFGVWAEGSGYVVLIGAMLLYLFLIFTHLGVHEGLVRVGTCTTIAYVCAMTQRVIQVFRYLRARRRVSRIEYEIIGQIEAEG